MSARLDIKGSRIALNLTLKQVADYVGVSEGTVSRWESGDISNMGRDKIYKLSKILQISPLLLLGFDEDEINVLNPGFPRKKIPPLISDKAVKVVLKIDSGIYDSICSLAEINDRSFENELEFLLYWAIEEEHDNETYCD